MNLLITYVLLYFSYLKCNSCYNFINMGETGVTDLLMPGVPTQPADSYICKVFPLNTERDIWLNGFKVEASADSVHHVLLYGSQSVPEDAIDEEYLDCNNVKRHSQRTYGIFPWARNGPALKLPKDVGFHVGGTSGVNFLLLEIHYADPSPEGYLDYSGLKIYWTEERQKYFAGLIVISSTEIFIPPQTETTIIDGNCALKDTSLTSSINLFAIRVHTHQLGTLVSGYLFDKEDDKIHQIVKRNPQWPQALYPMDRIYEVTKEDVLHIRCVFNSTNKLVSTQYGKADSDSMCRMNIMFYTLHSHKGGNYAICKKELYPSLSTMLPSSSTKLLPVNRTLEQLSKGLNTNREKQIIF